MILSNPSSASFSGCLPTVRSCRKSRRAPQISEPAVAEDDDPVGAVQGQLRRNLERGGHRLGEYRDIGRHRIGHQMQVVLRHGDVVGECPVVLDDPQGGPVRAVRGPARQTRRAAPAIAVDLAHHPLSGKRTVLGDADEFVSEYAVKAHVAADELPVSHTPAREDAPALAVEGRGRDVRGRERPGYLPRRARMDLSRLQTADSFPECHNRRLGVERAVMR